MRRRGVAMVEVEAMEEVEVEAEAMEEVEDMVEGEAAKARALLVR